MTKSCFVSIPFSTTTKKHTEAYWTNFFEKFIKPLIEELGYSCRKSEAGPGHIMDNVTNELSNADLGIAVLTDSNPNVMIELGIRLAKSKGTIMIIVNGGQLFFNSAF